MGQQGAAEHQPIGLAKQLPVGIEELPGALGLAGQVAHQRAVVERHPGLSHQLQQPLTEPIHAAAANEELAQAEAVGPADVETGLPSSIATGPCQGAIQPPANRGPTGRDRGCP